MRLSCFLSALASCGDIISPHFVFLQAGTTRAVHSKTSPTEFLLPSFLPNTA